MEISAWPMLVLMPKISTMGPTGMTEMAVTANISASHGASQ